MATVAVEKKQYTIEASKYNSKTTLFKVAETDIPKLQAGDLLIVNVLGGNAYGVYDGTHQLSAFYQAGDTVGNPDVTNNANNCYEFPFGSLVGTLDGGRTFFPIGNHLEMTVLQPDGAMAFVFWGNDASTNANSVTLTVEVQRQKDLEQFKIPVEVTDYVFYDRWQFDIDAKANSVSRTDAPPLLKTGLCLQPGDLITVDVHPLDFWSLLERDLSFSISANGRRSDGTFRFGLGYDRLDKVGHNFVYGSLVGTLDGGKTFFPVGTHLEMTALTTGNLALACWDVDFANNAGVIRAYVKVVRDGITITQPSNVVTDDSLNLGLFKNLSELRTKIPFDPKTCIWLAAKCDLSPSLINTELAVIMTDPNKKYKLQVTVTPGSAGFKNTIGIFPVAADGSVAGVKPGDPSYAETAVRNRIKLPNFNEESSGWQQVQTELMGGTNYEVFIVADATPEQFLSKTPTPLTGYPAFAYFKTTEANADLKPHVKALSTTTFGFEDLYGGGDQDFDDVIVELKVLSVEDLTQPTVTESDCPLYPVCKLAQLTQC